MIHAIETEHAGCLFRSRLEARWAVFFDALGIEWEYEPEAIATSVGNYLPDFRIRVPSDNYPYWFEVKPPDAGPDDRHRALCVETAMPTIVARGMPRDYNDQMWGPRSALTAMLWGDRLEGARFPAGDLQPAIMPCSFVGVEFGHWWTDPIHDSSGRWTGRTEQRWSDDGLDYAESHQWDSIHKARCFYAEGRRSVHLALYLGLDRQGSDYPPWGSRDVDRAYMAARSARFGS